MIGVCFYCFNGIFGGFFPRFWPFSSCKSGGVRGRRLTTMDEDDGDYATLRELPLPPPLNRRPEHSSREDTVSEEGKVSDV